MLVFVAISSIDYMKTDHNLGVYYSLLVLATIGMILIAAANDLLLIFVAWELGSLPVYSLAAYQKARAETSESALKFFLIGAMSSAFILFGISLVYGITGSTSLTAIGATFGILLPMTEGKEALNLAEDLKNSIENLKIPHSGSRCSKYLTASIGVSTTDEKHFENPLDLMEAADYAMYQAKHKGINQVYFETVAIHE